MTVPDLDVQLLRPSDWWLLRDVRLTALSESPTAYASYYQREAAWTQPDWLRTFDGAWWVVARQGAQVVGIARSSEASARPHERYVESIWVRPGYRRRGVMRSMIQALAHTARRHGVRDLLLWVLDDNADARAVYQRIGFTPTGRRQPLSDSDTRIEECLRLPVSAAQASR